MNFKQTYISIKYTLLSNRVLKRCIYVFLCFVLVAVLAPFLANDKPLVCKYKQQWLFPAFSLKSNIIIDNETINYNMGKEWKYVETDFSIFPICAYSPNTIDADNAPRKSPFDNQVLTLKNGNQIPLPYKFRHWLGTTQNGTDVLSGIIHGAQISISIGFFSMLIAALLGIMIGASAGYFENNSLKIGYFQLLFLFFSLFISYFICFIIREDAFSNGFKNGGFELIFQLFFSIYIFIQNTYILLKIGKWIDEKLHINHSLNFPLDSLVMRTIEISNSIPTLLLIIAISAISKPSYSLLIVIIGFLSWTNIARLTRAEYLKAKQMDYVTSCKAIGMSHYRTMIKHILPNVLPIISVQIIFGLAGAVLVESSLSFIGVGIPLNSISWGSLLNEARNHFSAWWLVVCPGICVFTLIYTYNKIAAELSKIVSHSS